MPDDSRIVDKFLVDPVLVPIAPSPIRISAALARTIDTAEERELPMVFAYIDENGGIRQTFRGSIHVHGEHQLAFWNRDPKGGFIRALSAGHDSVSMTYRERETPRMLQFYGQARVVEDQDERTRIWSGSPELERNLAHGRNGVGVIIELNRVQGIDLNEGTGEWKPFVMRRS